MKFMILFVGSDEPRAHVDPAEEEKAYAAAGKWFEDLGAAGKMKGGHELDRAATAKTVRRRGGQTVVVDGPFIEAKESIGGYGILDVTGWDEALEIAKSWPLGDVEVRPLSAREQQG